MKDLRKQITLTVVENAMIDIDNTGQGRYTFNEEQFGLLIDNLVKNLALSGVSQRRELLREYNNFNNKEMIYGGKLTDFEIDCFMDSRDSD